MQNALIGFAAADMQYEKSNFIQNQGGQEIPITT
jgi:hypothetical protein